MKMRATKVEQNNLIAKGMFLLGGHLTCMKEAKTYGSNHEAAGMVQEIEAALKKAGIDSKSLRDVFPDGD